MTENKIDTVVIFAGGKGTRFAEMTQHTPKPLIPVSGVPIIVRIMRHFYSQGYTNFVIPVGYLGDQFKVFFKDYPLHKSNVFITDGEAMRVEKYGGEKWNVSIIDTGAESTTAQRLHQVKKYLDDKPFFLTYGDSVSDVDLKKVEEKFFETPGTIVTITAASKKERFGLLEFEENSDRVSSFREKEEVRPKFINGGFMVCSPEIFEHVNENSGDFSFETLTNLVNAGKVTAYKHNGFWHPMDSQRDHEELEKIFSTD